MKHVDDDGLHLNEEGGLILGKNILNCLNKSTENNAGQHQQQHPQEAQQNDPTMRSSPLGDLSNAPPPPPPPPLSSHLENYVWVPNADNLGPNTVPGPRTYSNAHIRETAFIVDSTIGRINSKQFNQYLDEQSERIIMKQFPGHTADEINYYSSLNLHTIQAKQAIIMCGGNDVSKGLFHNHIDEHQIVGNILAIAHKARSAGAEKVWVSSVLPRRGHRYKAPIEKINELLYSGCAHYGYEFLDNSAVKFHQHIGNDGIHPNIEGHTILKMNVLRCMPTFNPYLCDFSNYYESCLVY
jgi:lysophospholipase L1-like esterase